MGDIKRFIVVLVAISAAIMELIDTSIVNVALSNMAGNLGVTVSDVSWVITSYAIANVVIIPLTGFLQSYFGRKNYFLTSIVIFTVASLLCGISNNLEMLVAARFLQGVGGGALLSVSQGLLYDAFPPEKRAVATAIFGMGIVLGPTFGPTLGGIIIDNYHWSWMFFINLPVGIVAILLTQTFVEQKEEERNIDRSRIRIDQVGILLLAVGIGSLQYVLERGDANDWFDSQSITVFSIIALVCISLFIWWELRIDYPVVNLRVFQNRNLMLGCILLTIIGFGLFTSVFLYPLFVQRIIGYTATQTGMLLIPGAGITLFIFPLVGRMLAKGIPPRRIALFGYLFFFTFCALLSTYNAQATAGMFVAALVIRGIGLAFTNIPLINSAIATLTPRELPTGIALSNMTRQLGGAFGIAIANTFITHRFAVHRNDLLTHIQAGQASTEARLGMLTQGLAGRGVLPFHAQDAAYRILDATVSHQALERAYIDTFQLTALFFLVTFPLLFLLKRRSIPPAVAKPLLEEAH